MNCNPQKVIDVALSQVGYKEKASNSQLDDKNANAGTNNYTKYARDIDTKYPDWYNGKKNGYDWCDVFIDWCFIQAYGRENAQRLLCQPNKSLGAGCTYSYGYYKAKGQVGKSPKLGAQIFFGYKENDLDHTGLVIKYDDNYVWTVEGNTGSEVNEVKEKRYYRDYEWIFGYGYPKYDEEVTPTPAPSGDKWIGGYPKLPSRGYYLTGDGYERYENLQPDIKLIQEFLQWVFNLTDDEFPVDGYYGKKTTDGVADFQELVGFSGSDVDGSYGKKTLAAAKVFTKSEKAEKKPSVKPQTENKPKYDIEATHDPKSYDKALSGTYRVNSRTGLNIRDGAGTGYKVLIAIPLGTKVECYGYYTDAEEIRWLYVAFDYNGKRYVGFASKQWLSK